MDNLTLKDHCKGQVHFRFYRDQSLWYETDSLFMFPVPISDIGTATFLRDDKAILFMRYIRKFQETLEQEQSKTQEAILEAKRIEIQDAGPCIDVSKQEK